MLTFKQHPSLRFIDVITSIKRCCCKSATALYVYMSYAFHRLQCWRCVSLLATPRWPRPGWSPRSPTSAAGTWATLWTRWRSSWRGTRPLKSPPPPGRSASLRWSASPRYGKKKNSDGSCYSQMNSRFWSRWVSLGLKIAAVMLVIILQKQSWTCFYFAFLQLELMELRSQQQDMEQLIKEQRSDKESRWTEALCHRYSLLKPNLYIFVLALFAPPNFSLKKKTIKNISPSPTLSLS